MLSPDIIRQIRMIEFKAGHLVTEAMAGNYVSAFKGTGMEFEEVREYVPGDDVRLIDWNVTARMQIPYIKVHKEEREMTLMLMIDVSPSQRFSGSGRRKNELSADMAAVLAFLAIRNNDKVGLIAFSDHVEAYIPPKKGRGHVWNIIRSVLTIKGSGKRTDIGCALDFLGRMTKRRTTCFLISDFYAEQYEKSLAVAARRHDMNCIRTVDPLEEQYAAVGYVELEDAETGKTMIIDAKSRRFQELFRNLQKRSEEERVRQFRRMGAGMFDLRSDGSVVDPLVKYLAERGARRRR
jgi:uncharacterized protein (DUF58 family)